MAWTNYNEISWGYIFLSTLKDTFSIYISANCLHGGVACQGGGYNVHCIPFERLCDGRPDCAWGEDEIYCGNNYLSLKSAHVRMNDVK